MGYKEKVNQLEFIVPKNIEILLNYKEVEMCVKVN